MARRYRRDRSPGLTAERTREAILNAASENSDLLNQLSKSEEAPSQYAAYQKTVEAIQNDLFDQEAKLRRIRQATEEQFHAHKKLRDSRVRRTFYKATRMLEKFEAKAMKEEREYFDALASQSKAEERERGLKRDLEEAQKQLEPLERSARAHGEIHFKIDALYVKLFDGPTPGFPQEDIREEEFKSARRAHETLKDSIIGARRALKLLDAAVSSLTRAERYAQYAAQNALSSTFFFDGALNLLEMSDENIDNATNASSRACSHLGQLPSEINAAKLRLVNALRSAKTGDRATYNSAGIANCVDTALTRLKAAGSEAQVLIDLVKALEAQGLQDIRKTARHLEDARQALEEVRQGIFEEVAGFGEAAPAYNFCCDRTDWHCAIPPPPPADDGDILNQPEPPSPEDVAARASQRRVQEGSQSNSTQQNPGQDALRVDPPPYQESEIRPPDSATTENEALISPSDRQSGALRTADALNSLGPDIPQHRASSEQRVV